MKLLLDTNVAVSGLLWEGSPARMLRTGNSENVQFYTSAQLLSELSIALSYPKFRSKISASGMSISQLIDLYSGLTMVMLPIAVPCLAPDPDDDVVIGKAIAAQADFIVTGDKALLSVGKYEGVRIVSVSEALQVIAPA